MDANSGVTEGSVLDTVVVLCVNLLVQNGAPGRFVQGGVSFTF